MWSAHVVVLDEDAEHAFQMAPIQNQKPVETLAADGADEAFGDRVRPRCAYRSLDDLDLDGGEHGVEGRGELAVAVADEELEPGRRIRWGP